MTAMELHHRKTIGTGRLMSAKAGQVKHHKRKMQTENEIRTVHERISSAQMRRKLAKVGSLAGAILSEDSPDDRDSETMLV